MKSIPIIDLFAGPGGLGEGFMSIKNKKGYSIFNIELSIEKEPNAHKTLVWRSFFRQFKKKRKPIPKEYYEVYKEQDLKKREALIEKILDSYPEGAIAKSEARLIELGSKQWPENTVDELIKKQLSNKTKWVLIGGPPCQAYSNVGRSRVGGIHKDDHRVYLYKEYLRIIKKHDPAVFVMENVKGLLSAKIDGKKVIDQIIKDLKLNGRYKIYSFVKPVQSAKDFLIKSEEYGIPQKRHRVILLGVRSDLKHNGNYLKKKNKIVLESVIGRLPKIRSGLNRHFLGYDKHEIYANGKPKRRYKKLQDSDENWQKYISNFLKTIKAWGGIELNGLGTGPTSLKHGIGAEYIKSGNCIKSNHPLFDWYIDKELKGIANHKSRSHLTQDLMRYLFASLYVENNGSFPRLDDYARHHKDLIPDHSNVSSGKFNDRFRVQLKDKPATTITSHISKDGHYFIHYDPSQCRSFTVREAARIQTFPDNYLFRGSRTAQYHQVGNAVPPYLASQMARIVEKLLNN